MESKKKLQFHSFNALRFFSFLIVFLNHSTAKGDFFHLKGILGVYFFFVLSGFLITYIVVREKKETGTINLKRFFIRRILRIWPMYFLILLFTLCSAFLIAQLQLPSSDKGYQPNWWVSFAFLENYRIMYFSDFGNVSPLPVLWSVCIEEHFYIVWGLLLYFLPLKRILPAVITLLLCSQIARYLYWNNGIWFYDLVSNFDFFMWGALLAWLMVFYPKKWNEGMRSIPVVLKSALLLLTVVALFATNYINYAYQPLVEPVAFGLLFMGVLVVFLPQETTFRIAETNVFSKWGLYTYSLYLNHVIVINLVLRVFEKMKFQPNENKITMMATAFVLTLLVSALTYRWIEKPFLNRKNYIK